MNQSEYLRNKQRRTPQTFGPARLGDESTRIMVRRFKTTAGPCAGTQPRTPAVALNTACCRPYHDGVGYRQASSRDAITAAAAGREICAAGPPRYKESIADCTQCAIQTPYTYDPSFQKAAAYMGKTKCCNNPPHIPKDPSPPCCMKEGNVNTFFANNIPATPIGPAFGRCWGAPVKTIVEGTPCCENPIDVY